jgi:predicted HD superfamily hydrolase involved in NAD metabolism
MNQDEPLFDGLVRDEVTEPYIEYARARLDGRRLRHSVGTAKLAAEICGRNGESPSRATVAGLVHDVARPSSDAELLAQAGSFDDVTGHERSEPKLLHGAVSARMVQNDMGCTDDELLFAVRHHTCGHPDFGILGKSLMIADYAELSREFEAVREIRKELTGDLDAVLLKILDNKILYLEGLGIVPDPRTQALRNVIARRGAEKTAG